MKPSYPVKLAVFFIFLFCWSCGGTDVDDQIPPTDLPPPSPPGKADEAYSVGGLHQWVLIGNQLTDGDPGLELSVTGPADTRFIDSWIDGKYQGRSQKASSGYRLALNLNRFSAGQHELLLAANRKSNAFGKYTFIISHPMYVVVSNDWDDSDNPDDTLERQERLHQRHPELRITHFVGPYTFTDPSVSSDRATTLANWVKSQRDNHGDEIGLHIHPYCNFIETTSVACRTEPSFANSNGDSTGYTVNLSAYTEAETEEMLGRALEIFSEQDLGRPTSFRAGGWTSEIHTLQALANRGFVAESSANNWRRLEEWKGYPGADLYDWNQEHWVSITSTTQPYYPSLNNILESTPPNVAILEAPDNGSLVDYVSGQEMIDMFQENWPGGALESPRAYVIGYHPPNFTEYRFSRIDMALAHIDGFLHSLDQGPVVYSTMSELPTVWTRDEGASQ